MRSADSLTTRIRRESLFTGMTTRQTIAEKYSARHFLRTQQSLEPAELGNAYWLPSFDNPTECLAGAIGEMSHPTVPGTGNPPTTTWHFILSGRRVVFPILRFPPRFRSTVQHIQGVWQLNGRTLSGEEGARQLDGQKSLRYAISDFPFFFVCAQRFQGRGKIRKPALRKRK